MGNLVNLIEFAKVGELRQEEFYLSRRILGILSFGGKIWLQRTLLACILETKQMKRSPFTCHAYLQTTI